MSDQHKSGFVSIVGKPNVGKSTLSNLLVGENLSIITSKAQTTRHRIQGIINGEDFQIVYSDTPGIIKPKYELQQSMMHFVDFSLEDADLVLWMTAMDEPVKDDEVIERLRRVEVPVILVLNKVDLIKDKEEIKEKVDQLHAHFTPAQTLVISATDNFNVSELFNTIIELLPVQMPYFPKDQLTDKPERFFASEIIREKIFKFYRKEVPYSTEVVIQLFKEEEDLIHIMADIVVERDSQKGILIGHKGAGLKKVGSKAREDMEQFFGKKIFLEQFVKVDKDWRKKTDKLRKYGYE